MQPLFSLRIVQILFSLDKWTIGLVEKFQRIYVDFQEFLCCIGFEGSISKDIVIIIFVFPIHRYVGSRPKITMDGYEKLEVMGEGTYGKVYNAKYKKIGKLVALKKT